jgi:hypothetical protein
MRSCRAGGTVTSAPEGTRVQSYSLLHVVRTAVNILDETVPLSAATVSRDLQRTGKYK